MVRMRSGELPVTDVGVTEKNAAEISKLRAEAAYQDQQAEHEVILTRQSALELEVARRRFEWARASDVDNYTYRFDDVFTKRSCDDCYDFLSRSFRTHPEPPVDIHLTSPGGDAFHGMGLVDHVLALREQGLYVRITVRGMAGSMAPIFLQSADERVMGPSSTLLVHKLSAGLEGSLDQIEDAIDWIKLVQERGNELLAERSTLTKAQIVRGMNRKDWSFNAEAALAAGLVDRIG
jgi:ATP-dependent protease ClpP protease subunit